MVIYNVTVNIDNSVREEWLQWMREKHVPDVVATGCFSSGTIYKIHVEEEQGTSYSIQYRSPSLDAVNRYMKNFAPDLQKEHSEKYKDKYVAFRTVLEEMMND